MFISCTEASEKLENKLEDDYRLESLQCIPRLSGMIWAAVLEGFGWASFKA